MGTVLSVNIFFLIMPRTFTALLLAAIFVIASVEVEAKPPSKDYVLKFYDEFAGCKLDLNKWSTYHIYWNLRNIPQIGHQQTFIEEGYSALALNPHQLKAGVLKLIADRAPACLSSSGFPYYSGMISTEKSYSALYGYYEARLRVPKGKGFWPTIWMIPSHGNSHLPEIDVLEVLGHETHVIYQYSHPLEGDNTVEYIHGGAVHTNLIDAAKGFHTYGLEWTKDYIAWFVDGKETQRVKNFAFDPHYYIISLPVGGHWPGNPDASTRFPSSIDIDYVRIYAKR